MGSIGELLGGRDHATVLHMKKQYTKLSDELVRDHDLMGAQEAFFEFLKEENENFSLQMDKY
jgi:chromosomal replication initiation ATPase DnaA